MLGPSSEPGQPGPGAARDALRERLAAVRGRVFDRDGALVVGWYPEFTMPALEAAVHAVWGGADLYSASQTPFFAAAGGRALGTSRAICAMITSLTGCRLTVTGKPSLGALRAAAARLG